MSAWSEIDPMSLRNLSVLLVEDSRVLAERLRETLLSVPGVQLAGTVDSETEAVAALQRHPVDVLLLDLHLRQGTGFGVLRAIAGEQSRKLVVIVLTNYDLAEYRRAAAALGARYFLDKLRDFDRLPALLQQIGSEVGEPNLPAPPAPPNAANAAGGNQPAGHR
jgi:two-component system, OmpR family, response regulator